MVTITLWITGLMHNESGSEYYLYNIWDQCKDNHASAEENVQFVE